MKKYRKRPVIIDAVQYTGDNYEEVVRFVYPERPEAVVKAGKKAGVPLFIETPEGVMRAQIGDYIIKGVNGEFYPCKSDIFQKTYEPAF